ncbi:gephyrin-like molybdotransferase Glp [Pleomorphomonas carboxyditropha]|uniref:Molybdopterin molybdenumtransferase n=1 Tax=Pleomorphomonas carboxyditropha TaxID=2023338 RepID=A0A2G9WWL3_9HYPH|nr:gephyrin-like molybdotransferase Glp [Pleomorphomonas carboxyditropha]PIO98692.1 molybdopterin molybdenumtransferase MoeA [Pleomorphomonas carboxyditropha]
MALMSVDDAQAALLAGVAPTETEWLDLAAAGGRTLAADIVALRTQPPADLSAMDGYALGAPVASDVWYAVVGESAAGHGFGRPLGPGEAARIFTGAPVPDGADRVAIQEDAERQGDRVRFADPPPAGSNIRRRGIDFTEGKTGLAAGTRLGFGALGLAAAMNHARLPVRRRPRVALIASGDELVAPGAASLPHQIVASSTVALAQLIHDAGGEAVDLGIAPDDLSALRSHIRGAVTGGADIVVVIGGVSVGDHDHTRPAFAAEGMEPGFWKIAMRPGKPLMHGRLGRVHALGLPGNPVSTLITGLLFLAPLVRAMLGRADVLPDHETAVLTAPLRANDMRRDFLRARLAVEAGRLTVTPVARQDSSLLSMLAQANALIVRREFAPAADAGEEVAVVRV